MQQGLDTEQGRHAGQPSRGEPCTDAAASLLRRAARQLTAWHIKYGEGLFAWLPPAGDVELLEDIDALVGERRGV